MKRKLKRTLILVFLAVASLFILAGCSFKYTTRQEVIDDYGLEASVTYYGNGGVFENSLATKTLDYMSGQPAINIGVDKMKPQRTIKRDQYDFDGWYYIVLDAEGNPTYTDETNTYYALGEAVDFTKLLEAGDHWLVAAGWKSKAKVQFKLVVEDGVKIPNPDAEAEQKEFANGDVIRMAPFNVDGTYPYPKEFFGINHKDSNRALTFVEYYTDENCTTLATWPIKRQETDTVIYAKYLVGAWTVVKDKQGLPVNYLEGKWEIVETAKAATEMFDAIQYNEVDCDGYWIAQDIDMSNELERTPFNRFNGVIHSNGATIKNLRVKKSAVANEATTSVFGKIGDTAELLNVNFENLTFTCASSQSKFNAYFLFESLSEKAKIENVTVTGTLNITISKRNGTYVANLMDANLTMNYSNYLFGGYATDDAYLAASAQKGFKVQGAPEEIVKITSGI
ncbi:MAG: hypothetical protein IJY05_02670 [Clostridia bacterium]|nr:hypothetical protein [Clostridia bacterium]